MKKLKKLYKEYEEIINYLIVGALGTFVNLLIKWGLLLTIFNSKNAKELQYAVIIAWIFSIIFAYITNRIFVFKSKNKSIIKEALYFLNARILTLFLDMFIMWLFVTQLKMNSNTWVFIWTLFSQALVIIMNYIFSKLFIFKNKIKKESNTKKIIFFARDLNVGGIEKSLINLLNRLVSSYKVTLVLEKNEGALKKDLNKKVNIIEHKVSDLKIMPIRKFINLSRRLIFTIKHKNHYSFSCAYATYLYSASKLSRITSKNNCIFIHNDYNHIYKKDDMLKFFNTRSIEKFKKIIFVSNESKKNFCKNYPELKEKTIVINNLINTKEILKKSKEQLNIKKDKNDIIFAYIGRLDEHQKKISRLLSCFKILINKNKNIKLWIIGDGEEYNNSKKFIEENDLTNNITLFGVQTNPYKYLKNSNYLILTSDYEGFPVVFNEANILGKLVFTTIKVSDDYYNLKDGRGFIIPKEVNLMAKNILEIMKTNPKVNQIDYDKLNKERVEKIKELIENEI